MDTPWTTDTLARELLDVMPLFGRTIYYHARAIDEEQATFMQVKALFLLTQHPLTVSTLAKKRGVSLQAASALVQGLVERGWVKRVPDPNDRRQSLLEVTPEGMTRAQSTRDQMACRLVELLEGLGPQEIAAAKAFLPALRRVLTEYLIADDLPNEPPGG